MKLVNLSRIFNYPLYINPEYIVVVHHTAPPVNRLGVTTITVASGGRGATSPATSYDMNGDHVDAILKAIAEQA
jgi:hypothetical protein